MQPGTPNPIATLNVVDLVKHTTIKLKAPKALDARYLNLFLTSYRMFQSTKIRNLRFEVNFIQILICFFSTAILSAVTWATNDVLTAIWMNRIQNEAHIVSYEGKDKTVPTVVSI